MASLKSFVVEGNLAQKGVSTNGAGTTSYGAKGTLNAGLQQGLKAKLIISDKTLSSVRARARAHRAARARGRAANLCRIIWLTFGTAPARAAGQQPVHPAGGRVHRGHQGRCGPGGACVARARAWELG